jgi:hypothetical protein
MQKIALTLLACLTPLLTPNPTQASIFAQPDAPTLYGYPYVGESIGTLFQVGPNDISVTQLGIWDSLGDGLQLSYEVALFCYCNETPLTQTTIPSGTTATLEGGSRWSPITPVQLQAGGYYVIAAYRPNSDEIYDPFIWLELGEATWGPGVIPLDELYDASDSLILPLTDEAYDGIVGANFQYNIIPTPDTGSTLALLTLALLTTRLRSQNSNAPTSQSASRRS